MQWVVFWSRTTGFWSHYHTPDTMSIWLALHQMTSLVGKEYIKRRKIQLNLDKALQRCTRTAKREQSEMTKQHRHPEMKWKKQGRFLQISQSLIKINVTWIQCFHLLICFHLVVRMRSAQISILAPKLVFPTISSEADRIYLVPWTRYF